MHETWTKFHYSSGCVFTMESLSFVSSSASNGVGGSRNGNGCMVVAMIGGSSSSCSSICGSGFEFALNKGGKVFFMLMFSRRYFWFL